MHAATHLALSLAALLAARPPALWPAGDTPLVKQHERQRPRQHDSWFGDDKLRHLTMSFATTSFAFAATRALGVGDEGAGIAAAAGLVAGIGKELHDVRAGQFFSFRDLVWDVAGVLAGYVLARNVR